MQNKEISRTARFWQMLIWIFVIVLVDQFSKGYFQDNYRLGESRVVIEGLFHFTYTQNTGAAFGMGGQYHQYLRYFLFLFIPVIAVFWLIYLMFISLKGPYIRVLAYTLIIGGAVGNLIDRFMLGYVVDFFHFFYNDWHFAVFNVADAAISVAAGLIIIDFFVNPQNEDEKKESKEIKIGEKEAKE